MDVKGRAVRVEGRFSDLKGRVRSLRDGAWRAALDLGASAALGQAKAGAGGACPEKTARRGAA